jgi:hypothetical protein
MIDPLLRVPNAQKATSYDKGRKKVENSVKGTGKSAIPPDEIMISLLVLKVKHSGGVS